MRRRGWSVGVLISIVVAISTATAPRTLERAIQAGHAIEFALSLYPVTLAVRDDGVTIEIEL